MNKLLLNGYAEPVPENALDRSGQVWFLPHHGVTHPVKRDKLRVVFDCACQYEGISLNEELLQGPDLTNSLTTVLLRFRQEPIAFMADIEGMFLQVKVPETQRDFLRFLWWPDGNIYVKPKEYRMTVHLFGATSSPSCANFALRRTASDHGTLFDKQVSHAVHTNFYVDDCLVSKSNEEDAVYLASNLKQLCSKGGFNLTKFVSNNITVLKSIPLDDRSEQVRDLHLESGILPADRALGVHWMVQSDMLGYKIDIPKLTAKPLTRRGILSAIASFFDPLGLAAPYVMRARILLQELTRTQPGWDETVPDELCKQWTRWLQDLSNIVQYALPRCLCPGGLSSAAALEVHHFADASERAYGVVSYIRTISEDGQISCSLLLSKAHLAPIKPLSIPRLELSAATLAVKVNLEVHRSLEFHCCPEVFYWTDSTTVLKYIRNVKSRFHIFVANRLAIIRDGSSVEQWRWVPSEKNPADLLSRGCDARTLINDSTWVNGPYFLREVQTEWPNSVPELTEDREDPEIRVNATSVKPTTKSENMLDSPIRKLVEHYSTWTRLTRAVAWIRRIVARLMKRKSPTDIFELTSAELESAERVIIIDVQRDCYAEEIRSLQASRPVRLSSSIISLNPKLDEGILRVGGRLRNATYLAYDSRCPAIIPGTGKVTDLIIQHAHVNVGHEGRQHVLAELRKKYWVTRGSAAVRRCLSECISCRKRTRSTETQIMADLPTDRVQYGEHPWVSTGVDFFGPFFTKRGRGQIKRYGVIFTCLAIRAVHLEMAESLSSDSFICALRRFLARRGSHVRIMRSDNGTNFVGANRELKKELDFLAAHEASICREAINRGIEWRWNPPGGSHFGGAWERLIRSIRKIINALVTQQTFNDEILYTFFCEAESIVNNRPLVPVSCDPRDQQPLTPNHLLHLRAIVMPRSVVSDRDEFSKKSWKRASYLAEQFWRRWRTEYLPLLQQRSGPFLRSQVNLRQGDVVLIADNSVPRGTWPMGLIEEVKHSSDERVRSVKVRCKGSTLSRPIHKLVKITGA